MPVPDLKVTRLFLLVALGLAACLVLSSATSGGPWPAGETYHFSCASGTFFWSWGAPFSGEMRTFGGPTSQYTSGAMTESFWDATDTTGLPSDQVRLVFNLARSGSFSGLLDGGILVIDDLQPPPGATYLLDTARITFTYSSGAPLIIVPTVSGAPIFLPYPSGWMSSGAGATFNAEGALSGYLASGLLGATGATYEIVVDNVPEPITLSLFASGALLLAGRRAVKARRKAV